jgi:zinc/manganese transport system ATP-binding protein
VIRLEGVTLCHRGVVAVQDVSGCFASGSLTAVVGPNGAGKTTLLRAIAGLHRPHAGTITVENGPVALLAQASALDRSFPVTCAEIVALGHLARAGALRALGPAERAATEAALAAVGMAAFARRPVGALSQGQFQRVLFARLIVQDAPIILLDEPFNAVDEATEADLLAIVRGWHAQGRTVIAVSHDLELVRATFPETLLLARVVLAWGPTAAALAPANRQRARLSRAEWDEPPPRPRHRHAAAA